MTTSLPLVQIALSVRDIQHSQRWYRDIFGFTESGGTHAFIPLLGSEDVQNVPGATSVCWWMLDGTPGFQMELFEFSKPHPKPVPTDWRPCDIGYTTVGFHVTDFDGTLERLARRNVTLLTEPMGLLGSRRVCVTDPDGILLEIMEDDPRIDEMGPRPDTPAVARFTTLSVPDLAEARRTWIDVMGLPEVDLALHDSEHEKLWGLDGSTRESFVVRAGDSFIEVVQYLDPVGKDWPTGYHISDLGILNIALGVEDRASLDALVEKGRTVGIEPNTTKGTVVDKIWYASYVNDPMGFSIELLWHGSKGKHRRVDPLGLLELGFAAKQPPVKRVSADAHTSATPEQVWAVLDDHVAMSAWTPFKRSEVVSDGDAAGVGLIRKLSGGPAGMTVHEQIITAEAPYRMEYTAKGAPGMKRYHSFVNVEENSSGGSTITWEAQYRTLLPGSTAITGRMVRTLAEGLARAAERH
ncbi:VOC family protein [Gordonia sp. LSe1-13]|uniref:VOC family protein n=1 Tax=Gordonia sesuvii TaxID=3116777 RepID=A0ABU7MKJ4_9ACTN|nr:VOC family protein [Gordonia sp. LSe1-13]